MVTRAENLDAVRPAKSRAGKTATRVGPLNSKDELTRLRAARNFLAQVMADPETASKDRPPLVRAFMDVDAKIVSLEEARGATAKVTPIRSAPSKSFDAARFA